MIPHTAQAFQKAALAGRPNGLPQLNASLIYPAESAGISLAFNAAGFHPGPKTIGALGSEFQGDQCFSLS